MVVDWQGSSAHYKLSLQRDSPEGNTDKEVSVRQSVQSLLYHHENCCARRSRDGYYSVFVPAAKQSGKPRTRYGIKHSHDKYSTGP